MNGALVMPRSHHPDADFEEQEEFKQQFPSLVEQALKTKDPKDNRPVLLMAHSGRSFRAFGSSDEKSLVSR